MSTARFKTQIRQPLLDSGKWTDSDISWRPGIGSHLIRPATQSEGLGVVLGVTSRGGAVLATSVDNGGGGYDDATIKFSPDTPVSIVLAAAEAAQVWVAGSS